jgi:NADH-quinone oxidoreductase subunit F
MAHRQLVLQGADERDLTRLDEYRTLGGYRTLAKARAMEPQAIVDELLEANLRGRGGAGFPMGKKASFLAKGTGKPTYLVVNADESEPGTFKDREIMLRVPHRLLEGCLITAHGIESQNVFIYIRGEYLREFQVLRAALEEVRDAGLLAGVTVVLHRGAGAYICGEESALLESLEGKRGQPRSRPPFPAVSGLYASPTLINNVQTVATVPMIVEHGGAWYASIGPPESPGTVVFSLSGNVTRPGNYELELGTPLHELIYTYGGGVPEGRMLKAIIPGGSSVPVLTPAELGTPLDYSSVAEAGSQLGAAAVIVIDDRACMVQLALRATQFYMHESCGKCTPCREGTRWMVQLLRKIEGGEADQSQLDLLLDVCDRILGKCLCALGDFAAGPVIAYASRFRDEFQRHIDEGSCPFGGESSLEGVLAPASVESAAHLPRGELVPSLRSGGEE